jgi:integrase
LISRPDACFAVAEQASEEPGPAHLVLVQTRRAPTDARALAPSVRLLAPLAQDLREWRLAAGRPADRALVFPREDGEPWRKDDWDNWRGRTWRSACTRTAVEPVPTPYHLRHSFASLLLADGRTLHYVAAQLGHSPEMTLRTYGHVIAECEDAPRVDAEAEIRRARAQRCESRFSGSRGR